MAHRMRVNGPKTHLEQERVSKESLVRAARRITRVTNTTAATAPVYIGGDRVSDVRGRTGWYFCRRGKPLRDDVVVVLVGDRYQRRSKAATSLPDTDR